MIVHELEYDDWLHKAAGTVVPEALGSLAVEDCHLRLIEQKLYVMLMDVVNSPHAMRLFQTGKRQAWDGARDAIEKANRDNRWDG